MDAVYILNSSSHHFYYNFTLGKSVNILKAYIHYKYIPARHISIQCNNVMLKTINNRTNISSRTELTTPGNTVIKALRAFRDNFWKSPNASGESRKTLGDGRKARGESRKTLGEGRKALGESRKAFGESRKAFGEGRKTLGEARKAFGESRKALGDGRKALGEARKASGEVRNKQWILANCVNNGEKHHFPLPRIMH
ncbi:MAG: hypothetical protein PVH88_01235 [Ignavibacteria bacterium]|jgi:hypothetical protein